MKRIGVLAVTIGLATLFGFPLAASADFTGTTLTGNTGVITCDSTSTMVSDLAIPTRTPAAGVSCTTAHSHGNRVVSATTPAVPDITSWKALHNRYQQRSSAQK